MTLIFGLHAYLVSVCGRGFSFLMRVRAAAASSNAQDTLEVNRRRTSGSVRCFPFPVDNFPIPKLQANSAVFLKCSTNLLIGHSGTIFQSTIHISFKLDYVCSTNLPLPSVLNRISTARILFKKVSQSNCLQIYI